MEPLYKTFLWLQTYFFHSLNFKLKYQSMANKFKVVLEQRYKSHFVKFVFGPKRKGHHDLNFKPFKRSHQRGFSIIVFYNTCVHYFAVVITPFSSCAPSSINIFHWVSLSSNNSKLILTMLRVLNFFFFADPGFIFKSSWPLD